MISSETNRAEYACNSEASYVIPFKFLDNSHILAVVTDSSDNETTLVLDVDYTVTGVGNPSGGVLTPTSAIVAGNTLTILYNVPATQETDYIEGDTFPAEAVEEDFDKLTTMVKQMREQLDRVPMVSEGSSIEGLPLPRVASRTIGWDTTGRALTTYATDGSTLDWDAITSQDINAKLHLAINVKDYGAVGDGATDDTTAIQDAIDACATLAATYVWNSDDTPSNWGGVVELFFPDGTYAITSSLTLNNDNRNLRIRNASIKATGGAWATTDYIFDTASGSATYITFDNCRLNCNNLCGGIHARARHRIHNTWIEKVAGTGIKANGSDCWIHQCIISQWTNFDLEHWDEANYTGVGIDVVEVDARITNCTIRWLYECIRISSTNIMIANSHIFNGMQYFADYNTDGTHIAVNPGDGGGNAVGRTYHPLIYMDTYANGTGNVSVDNCYLDNGTIELYSDRIHFNNCKLACNVYHSNAGDTYWIKNYADQVDDISRVNIFNMQIFNATRVKDIIIHDDNGNSWADDYTVFEASDSNNAVVNNEGFTFRPSSEWVSSAGPTVDNAPYTVRFRNNGVACRISFTDNNTTTAPYIGSAGDDMYMLSGSTYLASSWFSVSNTSGAAEITARANKDANASFTLREADSNGGAVYTERGRLFYEDTNDIVVLRSPSDIRFRPKGLANSTVSFDAAGGLQPHADNTYNLGNGTNRWKEVFAVAGAINTSDRREKNTIQESDLGLDFVNKLKPISYKFNVGYNKHIAEDEVEPVPGTRTHYGLISQDVKEILGDKDFAGWILTDKDNPESPQGLRYTEFIAPMIKAIQELSAKVVELETKLKGGQ